MEWLLLFRNMSVETKDFLKTQLGDLNDFDSMPGDVQGVYVFFSRSTSIFITYSFEMDGQKLTIWYPEVDEPAEGHCIFVENDGKRRESA